MGSTGGPERADHLPATTHRVYGEPFELADGTTVLPVARTSTFRRDTFRPVGVFVISGGDVRWEPAVDWTRLAFFGECIGMAAAVLTTLAVLRRPPWPDLRIHRR